MDLWRGAFNHLHPILGDRDESGTEITPTQPVAGPGIRLAEVAQLKTRRRGDLYDVRRKSLLEGQGGIYQAIHALVRDRVMAPEGNRSSQTSG